MRYVVQYAGLNSDVFEEVTERFISVYNSREIELDEVLVLWKIKIKDTRTVYSENLMQPTATTIRELEYITILEERLTKSGRVFQNFQLKKQLNEEKGSEQTS